MVITVVPRQVMILVLAASVVFSISSHVAVVVIQIGMAVGAAVAQVGWTMEAFSMLWQVVIVNPVVSAVPVALAIQVDRMDYLEFLVHLAELAVAAVILDPMVCREY